MYGAGHIADMISRIRSNKAMLRKSHYFKVKRRFDSELERRNVRYREISPEVLDQIKKELLTQKRIQTRKSVAAFVIATLLTIGIGYGLALWVLHIQSV